MNIYRPFEAEYEVDVASELPATQKNVFYVPPEGTKTRLYELSAVFTKASSPPSYGVFAARSRNERGLTFACTMPNPDLCCISCMGTGYIVNIARALEWSEIQLYPILQLFPIPERRILLLSSFTTIEAYDPNGKAWTSPRLCSDELRLVELVSEDISCVGWDASNNREIFFHVNLTSGRVETK